MRLLPIPGALLLLISAYALARDDLARPAKYDGYAWPAAPGCHQRVSPFPNFGDSVRTRKDGSKRAHLGLDIIPPSSDMHVYVAKGGVVLASQPAHDSGWGNYV